VKRISSKAISKKSRHNHKDTLFRSKKGARFLPIKRQMRALSGELIEFAKELIRVPTENPPGACYSACIDLISHRLKRFGMHSRIVKVPGRDSREYPRYNLVSSYGKGERKLYFHGHYDVVPGTNAKQFKPYARAGKLYGRGAADMKAGLAAMVYAVRALQLLDAGLDGQVCLVVVPDEETGGKAGAGYLFKKGYVSRERCVGMLMPEPTSGTIWNACRGAISLSINIEGKPVHVVMQKDGVNAFEQMIRLSNALLKHKKAVERRKTRYAVLPGESINSILMLGGICHCGTNFNVVPGSCTFTLERRINPEENLVEEKRKLLAIFEKFRKTGMKIDLKVLQEGSSAGTSSDTELVHALVGSVIEVAGQRPAFNMCPGLLEIRYYLQNGIPAYAYGPGLLAMAHHPDEFVEISRVTDCASIYALTAFNLLSKGNRT
jgi:succinyl-diaminopimelate desuccinylase